MRKNETITFEVGRNDLEIVLGHLAMTLARMEKTGEALKEVTSIIRAALQEEDDEPDCGNCDLPCVHNPNLNSEDEGDEELLKQIREVSEAIMQSGANPDNAEEKLKEKTDSDPAKEESGDEAADDTEDEAESLAIELLKAVFTVLTDVIENGE